MSNFNQYVYLDNLKDEIIFEIEKGNVENEQQVWDLIDSNIDSEAMYSDDCFDICKALHFTDFDLNNDYVGEVNNIYDAGRAALYDLVYTKLDLTDIHKALKNKALTLK